MSRASGFRIRRIGSAAARLASGAAVRLAREDRGSALVFTIGVFLFLFVLVLSVYSVGETIRRKIELQNACDAAAYSAAVVQADALSRMAVVNRAMAWSYIQMTKAELDYYTYLWLERVRDRFQSDSERCLKKSTDSLPFKFNSACGWWHSKHSFLHPLLPGQGIVFPLVDFYGNVYTFGLNCHEHVHDNPGDNQTYSKARWIGLGWDSPNRIRIGYETGGELEYRNGDLCIPGTSAGLVSSLRGTFGKHGEKLRAVIADYHKGIVSCNKLLEDIDEKMVRTIPETVRRTLLENLPRTETGAIDESLLDQYRWACFGGISGPPADYNAEDVSSGGGDRPDDVSAKSFFSGVRNVEEDELRFLNMAGGLPAVRTGPNGTATLKDWFADSDSPLSDVRDLAGGLDQWFIRCYPSETAVANRISLDRQLQYAIPGIVRSYKNANYFEGRSSGSILGSVAGEFNCEIHRGNHVLPSVPKIQFPNFSSLFNNKGRNPGASVPGGPGGYFGKSIRKFQKRIRKKVEQSWKRMQNEVLKIVTTPVQGLIDAVNGVIRDFCRLDVDPSCRNRLDSFVDQCVNVEETTGLVAEYEWATAYWVCGWAKKNGSLISCFHVPVPIGLAFGSEADSYGKNLLKWLKPELKMFEKRSDPGGERAKGFSREEYHDTFIGLNPDVPDRCSRGVINGRGANTILRAYARIYGDDKWADDSGISRNFTECKDCGAKNGHFILDKVPAKPWFLNERFFEGQGTIVVAIAKEQRNVFDWLADAVSLDAGLHAAFSPAGPGRKPGYYVALSAGRAGPAMRTGSGRADGPDTVNASRRVPVYEVAWDAVTDRSLNPQLAKGNGDLRAALDTEFRKQGYDLGSLERNQRWGCACGETETDGRLGRQWNLSQADWDGMLLPLRHAFSPTGTNDAWKAGVPVWSWHEGSWGESDPTGIDELFGTLKTRPWYRFDEDGESGDTTSEIVGPGFNLPLFRSRRIL